MANSKLNKAIVYVKNYANKCKRVLKLMKYPAKQELMMSMKITIAGFLIIGFIGFLISLLINNIGLFG